MTSDELKVEEACQAIRLALKPEVKTWVDAMFEEVVAAHHHRLQGDTPLLERQSLLRQGLEDALHHRILREMLNQSLAILHQSDLFTEEQRLSIRSQVRLWMDRRPPSIPVIVPVNQQVLDPIRTSITVLMMSFVGLFLGNQIPKPEGLPLLLGLFFAGLGVGFVAHWQRKALHTSPQNRWAKTFVWISTPNTESRDWLEVPKESTRQIVEDSMHHLVTLIHSASQLELLKQDNQQQGSDQLQHLFHRCVDGFAEIYYSDLKRDPERALDACIKLVGDLEETGIQIETVERDIPYHPEMQALFNLSGRIQEGEPVVMIFPAWRYRQQLLAKGTIKRSRR